MMPKTARKQIKRLADFIMEEVPGEPSQSEGAVDTAIRLLREQLTLLSVRREAVRFLRSCLIAGERHGADHPLVEEALK